MVQWEGTVNSQGFSPIVPCFKKLDEWDFLQGLALSNSNV